LAAAGGTPGELDLALLVAHLPPLVRELEILAIDPPDVLAAGIDQFEFQVVHRRLAADAEGDLPVGGQLDGEGLARHGIAGAAVEIEVEAEGAFVRGEIERDAVRGSGGPAGGGGEVVERAGLGEQRRGCEEEKNDQKRGFDPPLAQWRMEQLALRSLTPCPPLPDGRGGTLHSSSCR